MKRCEVDYDKLSPMMKQYLDIKKDYETELLFYRIGDFYELFFEDGELASRELELTLTGKNAGLEERIPMCGVPFHSVKPYIEKLITKGYKVAICEQLEDPKNTKGMVKRGVTNVIILLVYLIIIIYMLYVMRIFLQVIVMSQYYPIKKKNLLILF